MDTQTVPKNFALAFALMVSAPLLFGADDRGCARSPGPDGGSEAGACVSGLGGHCGGNTTSPCSCASNLVCTPGDGGLPFGDVGGTCEPSATDAGGEGGAICTIRASNYDSSCASDTDCAAIAQGNLCASPLCWCPSAAINRGALTQYQADVAGRARNVCACVNVGSPRCVAGSCRLGGDGG